MATISKVHTRLNHVDSSGNVVIIHPENTGNDVVINNSNTELPTGMGNMQDIVDNLGDLAFKGHDLAVLRFAITGEEAFPDENFYEKLKEINDETTSLTQGWSSFKINKLFNQMQTTINELTARVETLEAQLNR